MTVYLTKRLSRQCRSNIARRLMIAGILVTSFGCSAPQVIAPPVGGPCEYSGRETTFTSIKRNELPMSEIEFVFTANPADLKIYDIGVEFALTFLQQDVPDISLGQTYTGTITDEIDGTCPPRFYSVEIDGKWYNLTREQKL